jgi:hypothetical protein
MVIFIPVGTAPQVSDEPEERRFGLMEPEAVVT